MIDQTAITSNKNTNNIQNFSEPGQILRRIKANMKLNDHQFIKMSGSQKKANDKTNDSNNSNNPHDSNCNDQKQNNYRDNQIKINKLKTKQTPFIQMEQIILLNSNSCSKFTQNQKQYIQLQHELQICKQDIKQLEKQLKNVKQTLQKERKFFMSQMYSKQLMNENYQNQLSCLKKQIEKLLKIQFQISQKNMFLTQELQKLKQLKNLQKMDLIYNFSSQDFESQKNKENLHNFDNNKFYSQFLCGNINDQDIEQWERQFQKKIISLLNDPFYLKAYRQIIQKKLILKHQKEIIKNQEQIKNLIEFYELRIKSLSNLRRFQLQSSPKKRNEIYIQQNYEIHQNYGDNVSMESHQNDYIYQNLKMSLKDQEKERMRYKNSKQTKTGECQSQFTIQHFRYPDESEKLLLIKNEDDSFCQHSCCQIQTFKSLCHNNKQHINQNSQKIHLNNKQNQSLQQEFYLPFLNRKYIPIIFGAGILTGSFISAIILKKISG